MKRKITGIFLQVIILGLLLSCSSSYTKTVTILETTDIHGVVLPYDFIENETLPSSMASVQTFIKDVKGESDALLLLDNGDNLQGQPAVYYYNFIDTVSPHILSQAMNWMGYDATTAGNHDIEAGHKVYDRLAGEYSFPLLAANAVNQETGQPYFKPYTIIDKEGVRVAVFGLITPAVPTWLPPELYSGIEFRDMLETAREWMPEILNEKPDLVVGLFHSGWDGRKPDSGETERFAENGASAVAYYVPGFDVIFTGHDHRLANEYFINAEGDSVLILNGGSRSQNLARADITIHKEHGRVTVGKMTGEIIDLKDYKADEEFIAKFSNSEKTITEYVSKTIGNFTSTVSSRDAYFGSSAFIDLIHTIQLGLTGADISFAAPLSFDVSIKEGPVTVSDMFKLYRFENMLYTMSMTGEEIRKYLEYSYDGWINTMKNGRDYLFRYRLDKEGKPALNNGRAFFRNQSYNFDSAAGINYTVDVSKPEGMRVNISSFTNGKPFNLDATYKVAVNSYRGNGGGSLITEGAGLTPEEARNSLIKSTDKDLRYYMMKYFEAEKTINPEKLNNWKFIPESWIKEAEQREYKLLFGVDK